MHVTTQAELDSATKKLFELFGVKILCLAIKPRSMTAKHGRRYVIDILFNGHWNRIGVAQGPRAALDQLNLLHGFLRHTR